jgi:hypothetical protein
MEDLERIWKKLTNEREGTKKRTKKKKAEGTIWKAWTVLTYEIYEWQKIQYLKPVTYFNFRTKDMSEDLTLNWEYLGVKEICRP